MDSFIELWGAAIGSRNFGAEKPIYGLLFGILSESVVFGTWLEVVEDCICMYVVEFPSGLTNAW